MCVTGRDGCVGSHCILSTNIDCNDLRVNFMHIYIGQNIMGIDLYDMQNDDSIGRH